MVKGFSSKKKKAAAAAACPMTSERDCKEGSGCQMCQNARQFGVQIEAEREGSSSSGKESACSAEDRGLIPGSGGSPEEEIGFPGGSVGKESACNVGDLGLIPGLGRSLEKG